MGSPIPTLMTLEGWSNQYVDEGFWDDDDQQGCQTGRENHHERGGSLVAPSSPSAKNRDTYSNVHQGDTPFSGVWDSFHYNHFPCCMFPKQVPVEETDTPKIGVFDREEKVPVLRSIPTLAPRPRITAYNVITEVLQTLNETHHLEDRDVIGDASFTITPPCPVLSSQLHRCMDTGSRERTADNTDLRLGSQGGLLASCLKQRACSGRTRIAEDLTLPTQVSSSSVLINQLAQSYYHFHGGKGKSII